MTKKNRLHLIHGVFLRYRDYYDEKVKTIKVFVKSAVKLKQQQIDRLLKRLRSYLKKEIVLDLKVKPLLVGGLFVKIHDRIYDSSVASVLHDINKRLMG